MPREYNLQSGTLRHRIQIQSRSETRDAHGGEVVTWSTVATRWGSIIPKSATETNQADKVEGLISYQIVMRFFSPMDETFRLVHDGIVFNITAIRDIDERAKLMRIEATESENV